MVDAFGVIHDRARDRRAQLRIAMSIFIPLMGSMYGLFTWPRWAPTKTTDVVFAIWFVCTAVGINLGLHRCFSHAAFKTSSVARCVIATWASFAMQGPIVVWVADHRRHHRFTDRPGDPHSPYWNGKVPIRSKVAGFWHAHFQWMFRGGITDESRYAADLLSDRVVAWQSRWYGLMCVLSLATPGLLGYALGGPAEAMRCFLWAGCPRVTVLHEITRAVNSYGHMFGAKDPSSRSESRNNAWAFWLWLGEGLHSFHHRHPRAAIMQPTAFDPVGQLVLALERAGLVWDVRRASSPTRGAVTPRHAKP
jgi:stearoyl-CoA desaturase (Delta-9 desaturase)